MGLHEAEWGILPEIIVIFTGLNSKIEWCEQGSCMRLNGQIERFLHESEQQACVRLSKAASRLRLQLSLIKKKKGVNNQQLRVFLELYLEQCLVALNGAPFLRSHKKKCHEKCEVAINM